MKEINKIKGFTQHHFLRNINILVLYKKSGSGFSLVELIVAIGLFSILAVGVVMIATNSYGNFYGTGDRQKVAAFAKEAIEAARAIRDNCWQDVEDAVSSAQGLAKNSDGVWQFDASTDTQGDLTRTVTIANVQRNEAGDIVEAGGTEDPDTKKVTVTVSGTGISDYTLNTFLTNWSQKEWCQLDWSAGSGSEFWQTENMVYIGNNINTTTANQLTLTEAQGGEAWADWENLTNDATTIISSVTASHVAFSPDGNIAYVVGGGSLFKAKPLLHAYDITNARDGTITFLWSVSLAEFTAGTSPFITVHPSGNYAYVSNPYHGATGPGKSIAIVNLNTHAYTMHTGQLAVFGDAWLVIDAAADYLYAFEKYGRVYVYDISADGSSLTTVNTGQQLAYDVSGTYRFHAAWYDNTNNKIYATLNNYAAYNDLIKIDVTNKASLTVDYGLVDAGNFTDIVFAGTSAGKNRFFVISSVSDSEFRTYEDSGAGFTLLDSLNPSIGSTFKGVIYDDDHTALILSSDNKILSIDVADLANVSEVLTATIVDANGTLPTYPVKKLFYNETSGGVFYLRAWTESSPPYAYYINFIERPAGAGGGGGGGYESTGYATSSIFDIGSSDQTLSKVSIEQNVPSGCTLQAILQGSDTSNFASYESQTFSNAASAYTAVTEPALNGKRFLRYIAHLEPCATTVANDTTPTLYSFKLRYK